MIRKILTYPNPYLKLRSVSVDFTSPLEYKDERGRNVSVGLEELIQDMWDTLYDSQGIGLSAIQIGVPYRVVVVDINCQELFINPQIIITNKESNLYNEACLSLPGLVEQVERYDSVLIKYQDIKGDSITLDTADSSGTKIDRRLRAQCIQHELDHFEGILITDHLSAERLKIAKKTLKKTNK